MEILLTVNLEPVTEKFHTVSTVDFEPSMPTYIKQCPSCIWNICPEKYELLTTEAAACSVINTL